MSKKKQKSMEELLEEALVPEEEQPYKVPENWVWSKLGGIVTINMGQSPKGEYTTTEKTDYPLIGGPADMGETFPNTVRYTTKPTKLSSPGELIISIRATLGKVNISDKVYCLGRGVAGLSSDQIDMLYLRYYFDLIKDDLSNIANGTTFLQISKNDIENIKIPLPPINEQKRIAEKVERLFVKIDEAKRLIEEVKGSFELRWESILDKAFRGELTKKWRSKSSIIKSADDIFKEIQNVYKKKNKRDEYEINPPFPIPQNWRWVRLGDIVDINPARKKLEDIEDIQSCSFIPMPSVNDKTGEIENPEIRKYAEVKKGYTFFLENDILFAKITPCMENGKTAIAHNLINGFGFGSTEFHVIRTNPYINTKLIYYLLRSKKFRMEAKKEMTGAVGQQRVPKSFLENYLFPLPPKAEQDKIVELLDHLHVKEVEISKIEALEGEIDSLRQSILNKAFRGELGTNDPTDEHAIELLKEVLKSK
ncbi:restriction endonuclease [Aeribacillus pallidus]|jgi:type I restriction enzyme, S subunit|uniref:Restriction endonuclease n=1 Tax=Aeribacillus pallidus TaxID=33936 RepID=A0A165Z789_9BACI|nr:restriction endonuclease subunit S [Aeribacillus pallidus]KZN97926.1 restriction endonuclease [Aeribacillus pallidus]